MTRPLTIVAQIIAHQDSIDIVKSALQNLIAATLNEQGCLQYDLHQDNDNPAIFLFFENWQTRELWQQHMASEHIAQYLSVTEGKVASFTVNEMSQI
ncbi:putative quinol monooxygenase [Shewanella marina]|uniref:putative quinol monooxygenase n=1 Tax=Shewanella marina TaxID=487319 RepID=UPI00046F6D05|nr:putative quinol monooxygenase [Shewanella marina]